MMRSRQEIVSKELKDLEAWQFRAMVAEEVIREFEALVARMEREQGGPPRS